MSDEIERARQDYLKRPLALRLVGRHEDDIHRYGFREGYKAGQAASEAARAALVAALDRCMIGGNHIASALIGAIGPGFPERFTSTDQALEELWGKRADTDDMVYEVWQCWRSIMEARTLAGGPDWKDAAELRVRGSETPAD